MTRFARRTGLNDKVETRKKQEATDWSKMFVAAENDQSDDSSDSEEATGEQTESKKRKHEEDYDKRIEFENSDKRFKQRTVEQQPPSSSSSSSSKLNLDDLVAKYENVIDKEVVEDLIEMRKSGKISYDDLLDKLNREERSNRRRLNRIEERHSSMVCFKCRKAGHSINDCPLIKKDNEQGTGICYKCGSTEHAVSRCKVKLEPGHFPFAKCFICNEMGHLTKQCPDNPRGLYPNGGSCKFCSSVEHYARDCPENQKKNLLTGDRTVKKLNPKENTEELSEDEEDLKRKAAAAAAKNQQSKKKVVVFFK